PQDRGGNAIREERPPQRRHGWLARRPSARTMTTNVNDIRSRTRPIVQRTWFHGSPETVLPISRVIWLVRVVIGAVRLVGIVGRLPITIWTASASPAARIMPR